MSAPTRNQAVRVVLRGALTLLVSAVLAAPIAAIWGVGRAEITDYLGPNEVAIAVDYTGETRIDLGPLGNAYLPDSYGPVGLTITVHGVRTPESGGSILSQQTLTSYLSIYNDPQEAIAGLRDSLIVDAVQHTVIAQLVLMLIMTGWRVRQHFLSPRLVRMSRAEQGVLGYLMVLVVLAAVVIAPPPTEPAPRYPVKVSAGTRFDGLTVDSSLLADLIDRGVKGLQTLAERQNAAIDQYVRTAGANLEEQADRIPAPGPNEQMIFGFSDLHCSLAMIDLWGKLISLSEPMQVFSAGDDTMNGTASERACITREVAMVGDRPFVNVGGNHDSDITERQMNAAGAQILNGRPVEIDEISYLGDDDPTYNPPLTVQRIQERDETQQELGERIMKVAAGRNIDVIALHEPYATRVIMAAPNPPAKLIAWGHMHAESGPQVLMHEDGSWTVAMQMGTAGGVAAPTITSFSTPFSPPRTSADGYFYFRDAATGLITGVQPVHFKPDGSVIIDDRIPTGDLAALPPETRTRLGGGDATAPPTPAASSPSSPSPSVSSPTGSPQSPAAGGGESRRR